jgi:hypothetical protein
MIADAKKVLDSPDFSEDPRPDFERATRDLYYTKDFNDSLAAIMGDRLATIAERVLAWIKRYSWGCHSLYCIVPDTTVKKFQADCARELGVDKRRVSAAVSYLERRGYVKVRGKVLYPVPSPVLGAQPNAGSEKSDEFRSFYEDWKVAHSTDIAEMEVANSTVKRIKKVLLSDYKKYLASRTNGGLSLLRKKEVREKESEADEQTVSAPLPAATETVRSSVSPPTLKELLRAWLTGKFPLPTGLSPQVLDAIAAHIPDERVFEQFTKACESAQPRSWKLFIKIAAACEANREAYAAVVGTANGGQANGIHSPATQAALDLAKWRMSRGRRPL